MQPSINIYPRNTKTEAEFRVLKQKKPEKPPFKMNPTNVKNLDLIWQAIEHAKTSWRGNHDCRIPTLPTNRNEFWGHFAKECPTTAARHVQDFLLKIEGKGKVAIDLGCGGGHTTEFLLKRGWKVIAVDCSRSALEVLRSRQQDAIASGALTLVEKDINTYTPNEPADLVVATDVFPYLDPAQFKETWKKVHDTFIKPEGYLLGNLFYVNDEKDIVNVMREQGAWFLYDSRMVAPLVSATGYELVQSKDRDDGSGSQALCREFIAQKRA